jgi:hypothetical protein
MEVWDNKAKYQWGLEANAQHWPPFSQICRHPQGAFRAQAKYAHKAFGVQRQNQAEEHNSKDLVRRGVLQLYSDNLSNPRDALPWN